jgi:hypothetical protein
VGLPTAGGPAVVHFRAGTAGRYRVTFEASSYPPSDRLGVSGRYPWRDPVHPASRANTPSPRSVPATRANVGKTGMQLGLIIVR